MLLKAPGTRSAAITLLRVAVEICSTEISESINPLVELRSMLQHEVGIFVVVYKWYLWYLENR